MQIENWMTSEKSCDKAVYFRKTFSAEHCRKAVLKVSALGWVKVFVNGKEVTNEEFLPGWTDYTKRVLLFSYDVTELIKERNVIGAVVGKGWALGTAIFGEAEKYYCVPTPCLYIRVGWLDEVGNVHEESEDGWEYSYGAIIENDIMLGETWDYYQENLDIYRDKCDASVWKPICTYMRRLEVEEDVLPRVSVHEIFQGKDLGNGIYDFGQNFSGVVRLNILVREQAEIVVRHGELLLEDGALYVGNLRGAKAIDRYILPKGVYTVRPWFTYHGFRYAEVSVSGDAEITACEGLAIYTDGMARGRFQTSSGLVNKIDSNCLWSLKSNLHYIPTDCPQRDERLGWLGDAGVIARSAMFQFDCKELWLHYLSVIAENVREDGAIPCIAPTTDKFLKNAIGAAGWADAFLSILSDYYDFYKDETVIRQYLRIAENFIEWIEKNSTNYRRNTYCFSDWLSVNADLTEGYGDVDFTVFDLSFYALDCLWMQRFYRILGLKDEKYRDKYAAAKTYFLNELYKNGEIVGKGKQTALLLTYKAGFLKKEEIRQPLVADIRLNGMTSGFIGMKYLLPILTEIGQADLAYGLILSDRYPSWGYSVRCGATTIWERWDSYTKENGVNAHGMNSFNHFAFGTCAEWFYEYVLGIKMRGESKELLISPIIDKSGRIREVKGGFHFPTGDIAVSWRTENDVRIAYAEITYTGANVVRCEFEGWKVIRKEEEVEEKRITMKYTLVV